MFMQFKTRLKFLNVKKKQEKYDKYYLLYTVLLGFTAVLQS